MEDARGDLPQDELRITDDDRVAGVGTSLVANHELSPLGQHVDQLALALVAPLRTDDHHAGGLRVEHAVSPDRPMKRAPLGAPASSAKRMRWMAKGQFAPMAFPIRSAMASERSSGVSRGV